MQLNLVFFIKTLSDEKGLSWTYLQLEMPVRGHLRVPTSLIVIFTDNTNTVDMFNSMHGLPAHNYILHFSVDICLKTDHQLQVLQFSSAVNLIMQSIHFINFRYVSPPGTNCFPTVLLYGCIVMGQFLLAHGLSTGF